MVESALLSSRIECDSLEKRGCARRSLRHKLWKAALAQIVFHVLVYALAGPIGVAASMTSMVVARFWVESCNDFQHYGFFTRILAIEITNQADHHRDSCIPYYKLKPDTTAVRCPNVFRCFLCTSRRPPPRRRIQTLPAARRRRYVS